MKTQLKAELENVIQSLLNKWADNDEIYFYVSATLNERMTDAAATVFDIAEETSTYVENEMENIIRN